MPVMLQEDQELGFQEGTWSEVSKGFRKGMRDERRAAEVVPTKRRAAEVVQPAGSWI